jgi:acyl carrier protein
MENNPVSDATIEEVRQTVAEVFAVDLANVTAESSPDAIEAWDSIGHLNLILSLEGRTGVSFDPEKIPQLTTVQALADEITAQRQ